MTCGCCKGISEIRRPDAPCGVYPRRDVILCVLLLCVFNLFMLCYLFLGAQGTVDKIVYSGSVNVCFRLCVPGSVLVYCLVLYSFY